jgi:hypothetical protein
MPLVLTIPQLKEMSENTTPESFKGKIKKVFAASKGTNEHGDYSLQKIVLTDGSAEIEVMLKDRGELSRTSEGQTIYILAAQGERGLTGVKRKDNTYKNKTTPQVWVYDSAEVTFEGGAVQSNKMAEGAPAQTPPESNRMAGQGAGPTGTSSHHSGPNGTTNGHAANGHTNGNGSNGAPARNAESIALARQTEMKAFDKRVAKTASAYSRCIDAALNIIDDVNKRHKGIMAPSPELIEKMAMGLMVNACWGQKPSDIADFPMRPFHAYEVATPPATNGNGENHAPAGTAPAGRSGQPFNV